MGIGPLYDQESYGRRVPRYARARGAGASASAELLTLATAAGAEAVYDPDNPDTWTLRDDGTDLWYSAIADGLGNRPDMIEATAANQPKQITLSTGRKAMLATPTQFLTADFVTELSQPATLFYVARSTDATVLVRITDVRAPLSGGRWLSDVNAGGTRIWAGTFLTGGTVATNWFMLHGNFNGASSELFIDGTSVATGDVGANSLAGLQYDGAAASAADREIGPAMVFAGLKTNAELSDIRNHINANWPIGSAA